MKKRNWLVEDNLVALYIALYGYDGLEYELREIKEIIPHKSFVMRIGNFEAILTGGRKGLDAALTSPTFNELYDLFEIYEQDKFARLVNLILKVKESVNRCKQKQYSFTY